MQYAELQSKTHYSFLEGSSRPNEMVKSAAELGLTALAVTDRNGMYGVPKAHLESLNHPHLKLIIGTELSLNPVHSENPESLTFLAQNRAAYGTLCRLITKAHADKKKGEVAIPLPELISFFENHSTSGIYLLASPEKAPSLFGDLAHDIEITRAVKTLFQDRFHLVLNRFLDGKDEWRKKTTDHFIKQYGLPAVVTNDVHYHSGEKRLLQDTLTAIRHSTPLSQAGSKLFSNGERRLKSGPEMWRLFGDAREALMRTTQIAASCHFSMKELKYRYPSEWIPKGMSAQAFLDQLAWAGAKKLFPEGMHEDFAKQLRHELSLIGELGFADYFLTIWDIVEFARRRAILCQGRGSAANSVVCFCLGITAVDPVKMSLLFERFISAERGEPPDIDVDFEAARREEVIQYVYEKYGRDRAGMVAAVITYRSRLATREIAKVLEVKLEDLHAVTEEEEDHILTTDPQKLDLAVLLTNELYGFPRHLSIHSGGFTLSSDPMIEIVPIEPARMENRTIVQWDKNDLDLLGLLKIDLLSLGMLTALQKTLTLLGNRPLHSLPHDDPATYAMIRRADTVGVFQIESRAQMSMLPRLLPTCYYDLVVEVAIVRPGPIVGKMVHPYLRRKRGEEPVDLPHPALAPILGKTLGVPLFQEQVMKMAIVLAGFTPGEADELRRAIGAWRSTGSIEKMGHRLKNGLLASGLSPEFVERVFLQIQGFAEYGFPESHAASFALLAYASAYLKCHHPAEFTCSLINSQPMGFYSVHTLIDDAKRNGVKFLPIDLHRSEWDCTMEGEKTVRLGLRVVHGLSEEVATDLIEARRDGRFQSLADFLYRVRIKPAALHALAMGGSFEVFGLSPRAALWSLLSQQSISKSGGTEIQFDFFLDAPQTSSPFQALSFSERIQHDYNAQGLSLRGHPVEALRQVVRLPPARIANVRALKDGARVRVAGFFLVRQRPPTANGTSFATLEDETGLLDLMLRPQVYAEFRNLYWQAPFQIISGRITRDGNALSVMVTRLESAVPDFEAKAGIYSFQHPRNYDATPIISPITSKELDASRTHAPSTDNPWEV